MISKLWNKFVKQNSTLSHVHTQPSYSRLDEEKDLSYWKTIYDNEKKT